MENFIQTPGCRRAAIGTYLDGVGQECEQLEAEKYDRCLGRRRIGRDGYYVEVEDTCGSGSKVAEGESPEGNTAVHDDNPLRVRQRKTQSRINTLFKWLVETEG